MKSKIFLIIAILVGYCSSYAQVRLKNLEYADSSDYIIVTDTTGVPQYVHWDSLVIGTGVPGGLVDSVHIGFGDTAFFYYQGVEQFNHDWSDVVDTWKEGDKTLTIRDATDTSRYVFILNNMGSNYVLDKIADSTVVLREHIESIDIDSVKLLGDDLYIYLDPSSIFITDLSPIREPAIIDSFWVDDDYLRITEGGTNYSVFLPDIVDLAQLDSVLVNGNNLEFYEDGITPVVVDLSSFANTDDQTISLQNDTIFLEDGGFIDLSAFSNQAEVDTFYLDGTNLTIRVVGDVNKVVDLSSLIPAPDDNQTIDSLALNGNQFTISLEGDGETPLHLDLSPLISDDQQLTDISYSGDSILITIEDGNTIGDTLPDVTFQVIDSSTLRVKYLGVSKDIVVATYAVPVTEFEEATQESFLYAAQFDNLYASDGLLDTIRYIGLAGNDLYFTTSGGDTISITDLGYFQVMGEDARVIIHDPIAENPDLILKNSLREFLVGVNVNDEFQIVDNTIIEPRIVIGKDSGDIKLYLGDKYFLGTGDSIKITEAGDLIIGNPINAQGYELELIRTDSTTMNLSNGSFDWLVKVKPSPSSSFQLRNNTKGIDAITVDTLGAMNLGAYGSGTNTGAKTYILGVNAAGDIIELDTLEVFSNTFYDSDNTIEEDRYVTHTSYRINYVSSDTLTIDSLGQIVGTAYRDGVSGTAVKYGIAADSTGRFITTGASIRSRPWNGAIAESATVSTESDGVTVNFIVGGPNNKLTVIFSDGEYIWTVPDTIALTAGSDISPTLNYVYFLQSNKTLTISTAGWPAGEHAPLATVLVQSASSVQTDGVYKLHAWTDHVTKSSGQGHISDINYWIRQQQATYIDGVNYTLDIINANPDTVRFTTTSGNILQLHPHTFPAFNNNVFFVVNDNTTPYLKVTDLNALLTDSEGVSMANRYFSLVIWGSVSEGGQNSHLFVNLPSGSYGNDASLIDDAEGYANYNIPSNFLGTGFLIAELKLKHQSGGQNWESIAEIDLRGKIPGKGAGSGTGGAGQNIYNHSDALQSDRFITMGQYDLHFDGGNNDVIIDSSGTLDIIYTSDALGLGKEDAVILIDIDETNATGGDIVALEVLATEGSANIYGMEVGVGVNPIEQLSGSFTNPDSAWNNAVSALTEFTTSDPGGANNVDIFVADNDSVILGNSVKFEEIEFILEVGASVDISPEFYFSVAGGGWTQFFPIDGTEGLQNTGVVIWLDGDIPTWAQVDGQYKIKVVRTTNNVTTVPTEDLIKVAEATKFYWDKNGKVVIDTLGIGTTTPSAKLEVLGGTQVKLGNYTLNTDQTVTVSEDNFVLTYDNASGEIGLEASQGGGGGGQVILESFTGITTDEITPTNTPSSSSMVFLNGVLGRNITPTALPSDYNIVGSKIVFHDTLLTTDHIQVLIAASEQIESFIFESHTGITIDTVTATGTISASVLVFYNGVLSDYDATPDKVTEYYVNGQDIIFGDTLEVDDVITIINGGQGAPAVPGYDSIRYNLSTEYFRSYRNGILVDSTLIPRTGVDSVIYNNTDKFIRSYVNGVVADSSQISFPPENIYTDDGTLAGNRVVTMGGNDLTFDGDGTIIKNGNGQTDSLLIISNDLDATLDSALVFTSDGRLGIGTASPSTKLNIVGSGVTSDIARIVVNSTDNQAGISFLSDNAGEIVLYSPDATNDFSLYNAIAGADHMYWKSDGNVGIGTTSPIHNLHVVGSGGLIENTGGAAAMRLNRTDGFTAGMNAGGSGASIMFDSIGTFGIGAADSAVIMGSSWAYTKKAMTIEGTDGSIKLDQYGSGNITGTAAYNLEVDASGNIIETTSGGGGGGSGWELLQEVSGSGAQVDATWTAGDYDEIRVLILGLDPATAADPYMQVRVGGSWKTGSGDYAWSVWLTTYDEDYTSSDTRWHLTGNDAYSAVQASGWFTADIRIYDAKDELGDSELIAMGQTFHWYSSILPIYNTFRGVLLDEGQIDGIRLYMQSGNIDDVELKVYGRSIW